MTRRVCVGCGESVEPGPEWADEHASECVDLFDELTVEVAEDA